MNKANVIDVHEAADKVKRICRLLMNCGNVQLVTSIHGDIHVRSGDTCHFHIEIGELETVAQAIERREGEK